MKSKFSFLFLGVIAIVLISSLVFLTRETDPTPGGTETQSEVTSVPDDSDTGSASAASEEASEGTSSEPRTAGTESPRQEMDSVLEDAIQGTVALIGGGTLPEDIRVIAKYKLAKIDQESITEDVGATGAFAVPVPEKIVYARIIAESDFFYGETSLWKKDGAWPSAEIGVQAGGKLMGQVLLPSGKPAGKSQVTLGIPLDPIAMMTQQQQPRRRQTTTDAEGNFVLRGVKSGKELVLSAAHEDFAPGMEKDIAIQAMETKSFTLKLRVGAGFTGQVLDPDKMPLAEVDVDVIPWSGLGSLLQEASTNQGGTQDEDETNEEGRFKIRGLNPGKYKLIAKKDGWLPELTDALTVKPGETMDGIVLTMNRGKQISGIILDPHGKAIADAKVGTKRRINPAAPLTPDFKFDTQRTESNEEGRFTLTGIGEKSVDLDVRKKDYGEARVMNVKPGETGLQITLEPYGKIQGKVLSAADGKPVTKFKVTVTHQPQPMDIRRLFSEEMSSEDGTFTVPNLPALNLTVMVKAKDHVPAKESIQVVSGDEAQSLEFSLFSAGTLRGTVLSKTNREPVASANITLDGGGPFAWLQSMGDETVPRTNADASGEFTLTGLNEGEISIRVSHKEFSTSSAGPFQIKGGEALEDIVILLDEGGGVDGYAYNKDGFAIIGAMVQVIGMTDGSIKTTTTDKNGYFSIEKGLTPGQAQVIVLPSLGDDKDQNQDSMAAMMKSMKVTFTQIEPGKVGRVNFGAKKEGGVTVTGRVLSAGEPVPGAFVTMLPKKTDDETPADINFTAADQNGEFTIDNVTPGSTTFTVQRQDGMGSSVSVTATIPKGQDEYTLDLNLPTGRVRGRVVDASTGKAISGLNLTMSQSNGSQLDIQSMSNYSIAITNEDGEFEFKDIRAGTFLLTAGGGWFASGANDSYGRESRTVSLTSGEVLDSMDFSMKPGGVIAGTVRSAGSPVGNASIFVEDANGNTVNSLSMIVTDTAGNFRFPGLQEGSYTVMARASGYATGRTTSVQVTPGKTINIEIPMEAGTRVIVNVSGLEGKPLEGASVKAFDPDGNPIAGLVTLDEALELWRGGVEPGSYRVGTYRPGIYKVIIERDGYQTKEIQVQVAAQDEQIFEVTLESIQ